MPSYWKVLVLKSFIDDFIESRFRDCVLGFFLIQLMMDNQAYFEFS